MQGGSGADGTPGNGRQGGAHGRPYLGYLGHQPSRLTATTNGITPTAPNHLNNTGQQQPTALPTAIALGAEKTARYQEFDAFHNEQATDPLVSSFVGALPGRD